MSDEYFAQRYELLEHLGTGGMGTVYRAFDHELEVVVALKVLHPGLLSNDKVLWRFKQEVRLARQITHRNIARTYDWGLFDGHHFITMEFIEGCSLSDLLDQSEKLDLALWVDISLQICRGLSAAHEEGVIHRDLKPENVLLTSSGRAVLSDFGISRLRGSPSGHTSQGMILGTPAFMAPEQIEAKGEIDHRADIYAIGGIFYVMLTGQLAWPGKNLLEMTMRRLMMPPPDPRDLNPELPEAVAELVMRCMAQSPEDRYEEADELLEELESLEIQGVSPKRMHRRSSPKNPTPPTPLQALLRDLPMERSMSATLDTQKLHQMQRLTPQPKTGASSSSLLSVAVLPFRNSSAPTHQEEVEEWGEDLVDALSEQSGLKVRSLGHIAPAQLDDDLVALGQKLSVAYFLSGMVRFGEDKAQVRLRLLHAEDGTQRWSHKLSFPREQFEDAGELLAERVSQALETLKANKS